MLIHAIDKFIAVQTTALTILLLQYSY